MLTMTMPSKMNPKQNNSLAGFAPVHVSAFPAPSSRLPYRRYPGLF
ncbi:hypothetical protein JQX13_01145 [Archangium violaceum]|nr:hypothetical protein [Archangium violaceum]QRK08819.1 hypothetical protein JQX13_01145 [Archangium violaceum]